MTETEVRELISSISDVLRPHLARSPSARRVVSLVGKWLIEEAACAAVPLQELHHNGTPNGQAWVNPLEEPPVRSDPEESSPPATVPAREGINLPVQTVELKIGDASLDVPVRGSHSDIARARDSLQAAPKSNGEQIARDPDLAIIAARARLKAESCRLYCDRNETSSGGERSLALEQRIQELITKAKAMEGCYLWVLNRTRRAPELPHLREIGVCYEALALAAEFMIAVDTAGRSAGTDLMATAMKLLAEASSALRAALSMTWLKKDDRDQLETYVWLRRETSQRGVLIDRYMQADDPADPALCTQLCRRIEDSQAVLAAKAKQARTVTVATNRLSYHARQIADNVHQDRTHDWRKITETIISLMQSQIAPTDRRIVNALAIAAGAVPPAELNVGPLAAALDAARATVGFFEENDDDTQPARGWSQQVMRVRRSLQGQRLVLLGGERKTRKAELIQSAFGLREVEWVEITEHGSSDPMRAPIEREDTAIVLVLVKLAGHQHVENARKYATAAGKPLVILKAGYNPEQAAEAIVAQVSERLAISDT